MNSKSSSVALGHSSLAAAVEQAADSFVITDIDGKIRYVNPAFTAMTGYTGEEVVGQNPRILKSGSHPAAFYKELWSTILSGRVWQGEVINRRKDGTLYHEEMRITPVRDADGATTGYIAIKHDVTEQRAAQDAQAFLAAIVENSVDPIIACTPEGTIRAFNRGAETVFGYSAEEVIGQHMSMLVPPDRSTALEDLAQKLLRGQRFSQYEGFCLRKNGCKIEVSVTGFPIKNSDGEVIAISNILHDITQRREAEQSRSLLASIVESSQDAIHSVTLDGTILSWNHSSEALFGYSSEEVIGKSVAILAPPGCSGELYRCLEAVKNDSPVSPFETVFHDSGGREIDVRLSVSPTRNRSGQVTGASAIARDIRQRRESERRLRESEERFRSMADSSPSMMWVSNAEGELEFINRKYREFSGITGEEVQAGRWRSLLHPDDALGYLAAYDRAIRERTSFSAEARVRRADGQWRLIGSRGEPRFSPQGEYLGHIGLRADITERKKAEEERQFQHSLIRTIHEVSLDGILVVNGEGKVVSRNAKFLDVWHIPSEEVPDHPVDVTTGATDNPLMPPCLERVKDPDAFLKRIQELYADRDANDQCEIELKDGRTLERYSTSLRNEDGEYLARAWFFRDITERKQAEQALQSSEEKFRQLTENIREVFWLKTPGSDGFLYVSPAYEQIWGRTCASIYQDPASRLEAIHPDDLAQSRLMFARQMLGEAVETEYRIRTQEGREKWIRDRAFPVRNSAGQLIRVVGIVEDITERKLHEQELNRAQKEAEAANRQLSAQHAILDNERKILRTFMDNIPDLMFVKDVEGRYVVSNLALAQRAGVKLPEDMVGKTDSDFFPSEIAGQLHEDDQQVIRSGRPIFDREETIGMDATNQPHYLLTTKVPLFDSEGHVIGVAGIGRDITMRKTMEDAVRESNLELREATDWATKLALEAEEANRAKSEFLANMSHEIRTPMNGVMGMNGLLLGTDLDSEQRHFAEVVDASAKSLLTLIDDILDYSKVEAGKMEIDTMDFNLRVLLDDFAEVMAGRVGERKLEFVCAVAPDVTALLQGDPGRLRQVLLNLVGNAMKFTRQGEVVVRVDLVSETEAEAFLRFSVRDTGIGIPANKLPMLFTSFTQVDASTTRRYGGTGLGLAISKKLVELMGGNIGAESKEHEGSEFWFTIRLVKQLVNKPVDASPASVKGTRILVVDDNATNREVLTAQLQSWGAIVAAVESPTTALACLRYSVAAGRPFQLAMLDMMMPEMDGMTLGRTILADETLKDISLVMMTSMGQRGDAHRFKEIGFAAYLIKPLRQSDLFDCLVAVLAGERQKETRTLITRYSLREVRRGNARILLVEDNLTNQEVAGGMLRRLGWHTDVAADGKQAVQALETKSYDLVLMDVQMPVMDGYEATRLIRDPQSSVLNHDIPIIATTAHAMQGDAEKCLAAGMSDYISKPIDPKILANVVEKWLTRKVQYASGEAPVESAADGEAPPPKLESGSLVFHREQFLQRMMGDEEFAREVAAGFVNELPAMLSALREQVALGDLESIWKQAHKMKGSAANVGGEALRDAAMEVEQAGKAGDLTRVAHWIPELEMQSTRLNEALQQWGN